jgi:hypothetical protein
VRVAVGVRLGRISGGRVLQENLDLVARLCDAVHIVAVLVAVCDIGGPHEGSNGQDGKKDLHGDDDSGKNNKSSLRSVEQLFLPGHEHERTVVLFNAPVRKVSLRVGSRLNQCVRRWAAEKKSSDASSSERVAFSHPH